MITVAFTAAGAGLLLLIVYDVYATVLHASARYGPIGERLNRLVWRAAKAVALRLSRPRRHKLLNAVGPALLPFLVAVYIVLLVTAFALIYLPRMPAQFNVDPDAVSPAWIEAIYFSGITLTTVGYGDIAPRSTPMRFLALVEAASGFALISLTVTYLLAVYSALERKRTVALSIYHQAGEGADVAGYIAYHFVEGRFYGLREELRAAARDIQSLLESHNEHSVIHYFHPMEVYKSFPRILFILLEACAVIRSSLDREEYADLRNYPEVRTLAASTRLVLDQLVTSLDLERRRRPRSETPAEREDDERRWRRRYLLNLQSLIHSGIRTRSDMEAGWREYRAEREEWESKLQRFSLHLGYDWDEVTGDRDLEYAADEEKEEPQEVAVKE